MEKGGYDLIHPDDLQYYSAAHQECKYALTIIIFHYFAKPHYCACWRNKHSKFSSHSFLKRYLSAKAINIITITVFTWCHSSERWTVKLITDNNPTTLPFASQCKCIEAVIKHKSGADSNHRLVSRFKNHSTVGAAITPLRVIVIEAPQFPLRHVSIEI